MFAHIARFPEQIETYVVFLLVSVVTCGQGDSFPPKVNTCSGTVVGTHLQTRYGRTILAFLGIPFAQPPVGDLRFEPPLAVDPWNYDLNATTQPPRCFQLLEGAKSSEDCLYLDVYTPKIDCCSPLAVAVWFYGGIFEIGAVSDYTPDYLLVEDIIFVTVNYRLGLFGFLSTADEEVPGNMGLKDMRLGLRWVRDNIRHFGGDPTKVTIFGQSAGAIAVNYFMKFINHEGLFRGAICNSGSSLVPWGFRPPSEVKKQVVNLAALSLCPSDSPGFVRCLKEKTAGEILVLYQVLYKNLIYFPVQVTFLELVPLISPVLEPECVQDRIISENPWRRGTNLPWLVGVNSKESTYFFLAEISDRTDVAFAVFNDKYDTVLPLLINYQNSAANSSGVTQAIRQFYLDNQPISRPTLSQSVDTISDPYFIYGVYEAILRSCRDKAYVYLYDYIGPNEYFPIPPDGRTGATHIDELYNFFPHPGIDFQTPRFDSEYDVELSKQLITLWTNFIKYLDPTPCGCGKIERWVPFSCEENYLYINKTGLYMERGFLPERMQFWKEQPFPYRDESIGSPDPTPYMSLQGFIKEFVYQVRVQK